MDVHSKEGLPRYHLPQLEARIQRGPHHVLPAAGNAHTASAASTVNPEAETLSCLILITLTQISASLHTAWSVSMNICTYIRS